METHCGHTVEAHSGHQSCPYTSYIQQDPVLPLQSPSRGIKDNKEEMLKGRGTNQEQRELYLHIRVLQNICQEGCGDSDQWTLEEGVRGHCVNISPGVSQG